MIAPEPFGSPSAVPPRVAVLRLLSGCLLEVVKSGPADLRDAAEEERAAIQRRLEAAHAPKLNTGGEVEL